MVTKTYKADTMLEALQMVQAELGPDAIVLSAREASDSAAWGLWKRPGVEVVAAPAGPINAVLNRSQPAARPQAPAQAQAPQAQIADGPMRDGGDKIEWVTGPEPRSAPMPVYPPAPKTTTWQPAHFTKDEVHLANRQGRSSQQSQQSQPAQRPAAQPQAFQPPVAQPVAVEERQPARKPSEDTAKALATILEAMKSATAAAPAPVAVAEPAPAAKPKQPEIPLGLRKIRQHLAEQGVEEAVLERVFNVSLEMFSSSSLQNEDVCRKYVQKLLEADLREQNPNTMATSKRVICLVGMSGSGKTSAVAKMALLFSQKLGRRVAWVCADTLQTGAVQEARAYCDALGIELSMAYTPEDLREAASAAVEKADVVLVDTPGFNPFSEEQMVELGHMLTELPSRMTYFVAPANLKDGDLNRAAAALGIFGLDGVILTKLDETYSYGSVYNFARKSQLPLGYFASGKGAEGPLQAGTSVRLVNALFGKGWGK